MRVDIDNGDPFTFHMIASSFAMSGGAPGGILGPSRLQCDAP